MSAGGQDLSFYTTAAQVFPILLLALSLGAARALVRPRERRILAPDKPESLDALTRSNAEYAAVNIIVTYTLLIGEGFALRVLYREEASGLDHAVVAMCLLAAGYWLLYAALLPQITPIQKGYGVRGVLIFFLSQFVATVAAVVAAFYVIAEDVF